MTYVRLKSDDIDYKTLHKEMMDLLETHHLMQYGHENQISLTSITGKNDWEASIGRLADLPEPEFRYCRLQEALRGTYFQEMISHFRAYSRWRLLRVPRRSMPYSIHRDGNETHYNFRLHIPIETNPEAFLTFFTEVPQSGKVCPIHFEHLKCGNAYVVNTTDLHSAWNLGNTDRYHIVGVRYEDRLNGEY